MDIGFLKTLREEWPVIRTAPWSFIISVVIAFGLGFLVSTLTWTGTVSTLRERVSLYQDRLQGASPDQAAQKMVDLEKQIKELQPHPQRHLTASVTPQVIINKAKECFSALKGERGMMTGRLRGSGAEVRHRS